MFSRGFIAALGGIAMTLLAWFGPWAWPGWPASIAIDILSRVSNYPDVPQAVKALVVVILIVINVGAWALLVRGAMQLLPRRGDASRATNQSGGPSSS